MADEINVKVTADVNEFAQGMKSAADSTGVFDAAINKAAADAQKVNPAAFKALAQELNAGTINAQGFSAGIEKIITPAADATEKVTSLAHGSSAVTRELVVLGREAASGNFNRLPGSISVLLSRMGLLTPSLFAGAAAVAGVGYAMFESAAQAERFDESMGRIQARLEALGEGASFDPKELSAFIDELRILPGVDTEAATSIVENFKTASNIGGDMVGKLTGIVGDFATATGTDAPKAAAALVKAFDDPEKSGAKLAETLHLLSPAEQEAFDQAKALNNVAQEQAILFDALSDRITGLREKSLTPMQQADELVSQSILDLSGHVGDSDTLWQRMGRSIQQDTIFLKEMGAEAIQAGGHLGELFSLSNWSSMRLPKKGDAPGTPRTPGDGSAVGGAASASGPAAAAPQPAANPDADRQKQQLEMNAAIKDGTDLFDKGNSPLREQEQHLQRIQRLQGDLNAAVAADNGDAAQKIQAQIDQENKLYAARTKDKGADKYAMAEAKGDAEAADARIKTEQDLVNEKLRLGEISTADAVKQLKELAAQEHEINLKRIADMRAVYARQGDKAGVAKSDGDAGKENARYEDQDNKIDAQGAEATKKSQEAEIEGDRRVADEKVRTAEVANQEKVALGQMSARQEIEAEIQAANQKHALDDQYFQSLLTHEAQDSAAYKKTLADKLVAEEKFNQQVLQLRTKQLQQEQQQENQLTKSLTTGLNQTVNGVLTGTQTMSQAFQRMGQNMVLSVVEGALDKILTSWLSNNATIQAAQTALQAFLGLTEGTGAEAADLITSDTTSSQIDSYAASGAAAATAATAAIPLIGPELAPEAGAAMFAEIESYQLASAAGGMIVDGDQIARVHDNEMVLPARFTGGLTSMIDQANAGGGGGTTHNHYYNVTANGRLNAKDLDGLHDAVVGSVSKAARNGQFGGMRT
jgi:hypothetical protein